MVMAPINSPMETPTPENTNTAPQKVKAATNGKMDPNSQVSLRTEKSKAKANGRNLKMMITNTRASTRMI
jgi:hypothetical protein